MYKNRWLQMVQETAPSESMLRSIPCMHQDLGKSIIDYFVTIKNMNPVQLLEDTEWDPHSKDWVCAYSFQRLLRNIYAHSKGMITPGDFYHIARRFVNGDKDLFKMIVHLNSARETVLHLDALAQSITHLGRLQTLLAGQGKFHFTCTPYPYYQKVTMGAYCQFMLGFIDEVFQMKGLPSPDLHETLCSARLDTLIHRTYARLKWQLVEKQGDYYLNGHKFAQLMPLQTSPGREPIMAAKIVTEVSYEGRILFERGEIYNAPYCRIEGRIEEQEDGATERELLTVLRKELAESKEKDMLIFYQSARMAELEEQFSKTATRVITVGDLALNLNCRKVFLACKEIRLTQKEFHLLWIFMEKPNHIYTRHELQQCLDGIMGTPLQSRAIDTHINNLRRKLGAYGKLIKAKYGDGYLLVEEKAEDEKAGSGAD